MFYPEFTSTDAPAGPARVIYGEGKGDYEVGCHNELVNPGESLWKWTTVDDELRAMP